MIKDILRCRPPPARLLQELHEHRRWLDSFGVTGARIGVKSRHGYKLTGLDLEAVDFSLGILNFARFENCNFRKTWWVKADLEGAMFTACDLEGARFDQADMHLACVLHSEITTAVFDAVAVENVIWSEDQAIARQDAFDLRYRIELEKKKHWTEADWHCDRAERAERIREFEKMHQAAKEAGRTSETIARENLQLWRKIRCAGLIP